MYPNLPCNIMAWQSDQTIDPARKIEAVFAFFIYLLTDQGSTMQHLSLEKYRAVPTLSVIITFPINCRARTAHTLLLVTIRLKDL